MALYTSPSDQTKRLPKKMIAMEQRMGFDLIDRMRQVVWMKEGQRNVQPCPLKYIPSYSGCMKPRRS